MKGPMLRNGFDQRLKTLMAEVDITPPKLARAIGAARSTVNYWVAGDSRPSDKPMRRLAEYFGVQESWLRTGRGSRELPAVMTNDDVDGDDKFCTVLEYRLQFAAGAGAAGADWVELTDQGAVYRRSFFRRIGVSPDRCRRARVAGDSMAPLICDGDTVLFEELRAGDPVRDGRIYVLCYGGDLRIKRLRRRASGDLVLVSDNSQYPEETVSASEVGDTVRILGLVLERSGLV